MVKPDSIAADALRLGQVQSRVVLRRAPVGITGQQAALLAEKRVTVKRIRIGALHRDAFSLQCLHGAIAGDSLKVLGVVSQRQKVVRIVAGPRVIRGRSQTRKFVKTLAEVGYIGGAS